jgi:hypothetical protein
MGQPLRPRLWGFGVVLAIYFWILFSAAVIVIAATVSPALAERRSRRRGP